jgi:hypothetical protein
MRYAKDITDVKTCRGADCNSDHFQSLPTSKKVSMGKKEIRYNSEALKQEDSRARYKQMISNGLKEHDRADDIEERWKKHK